MTHADKLASAMTRAAIELASLVGLRGEPDEDRILDVEQVPCAAWNAATRALDTLMLGIAVIDSCKDTRPMIDGKLDAELAALLGERRAA